jgi:hypothetical protein
VESVLEKDSLMSTQDKTFSTLEGDSIKHNPNALQAIITIIFFP